MEWQPHGINRVPKVRRVPYKVTKKLRGSHKINRRSSRKNKEAIRSEKKKSLRIKDWEQCMIREQEYSFEQTLKKVGPKKIWTF